MTEIEAPVVGYASNVVDRYGGRVVNIPGKGYAVLGSKGTSILDIGQPVFLRKLKKINKEGLRGKVTGFDVQHIATEFLTSSVWVHDYNSQVNLADAKRQMEQVDWKDTTAVVVYDPIYPEHISNAEELEDKVGGGVRHKVILVAKTNQDTRTSFHKLTALTPDDGAGIGSVSNYTGISGFFSELAVLCGDFRPAIDTLLEDGVKSIGIPGLIHRINTPEVRYNVDIPRTIQWILTEAAK